MPLSRPLKLVIGALTALPLLYMLLFFTFIIGTVFWISMMPGEGGSRSSGPPVAVCRSLRRTSRHHDVDVRPELFYIVFLFKTDRVPQDKKALWAAVLFLGNMLAMPVFFYLYVWPDEWPRKGQRIEAAPA